MPSASSADPYKSKRHAPLENTSGRRGWISPGNIWTSPIPKKPSQTHSKDRYRFSLRTSDTVATLPLRLGGSFCHPDAIIFRDNHFSQQHTSLTSFYHDCYGTSTVTGFILVYFSFLTFSSRGGSAFGGNF